MAQDETWHGGRARPRPYCVRWGSSAPKKEQSPQFSARVRCGQTAGWIKMSLGTEEGHGPCDIVLDGDPPPPKGGTAVPTFRHTYCGERVGWMKMPLGMEVGLSPGHVVLYMYGDPAPTNRAQHSASLFGPCLLWPNGRLSQLFLSTCYHLQ